MTSWETHTRFARRRTCGPPAEKEHIFLISGADNIAGRHSSKEKTKFAALRKSG